MLTRYLRNALKPDGKIQTTILGFFSCVINLDNIFSRKSRNQNDIFVVALKLHLKHFLLNIRIILQFEMYENNVTTNKVKHK